MSRVPRGRGGPELGVVPKQEEGWVRERCGRGGGEMGRSGAGAAPWGGR